MARAHEALPPSRLKGRRKRARVLLLCIAIVVFLAVCGAVIGASYLRFVTIRDVVVEGAETVEAEVIKEKGSAELSGRYFFVFPKANALLYPKKRVEADLREAFPKLKNVEIDLPNLHTLRIAVEERKPAALWCGVTRVVEQSDEKGEDPVCYFLDEWGFTFEVAPTYSGTPYVRWYGKLETDAPGATQYLTEDVFRALRALVEALSREGATSVSVDVDGAGDVRCIVEGSTSILFSINQKGDEVLERFRLAKESEVLKGKDLTILEYLDLRFGGNRLYFKLK